MIHLDFSNLGKRPTAAQIVKRWKDAGAPAHFSASYGETYAEFQKLSGTPNVRWDDSGNGCAGIKRGAVVKALIDHSMRRMAKFQDLAR
jgi:hypothetical protein